MRGGPIQPISALRRAPARRRHPAARRSSQGRSRSSAPVAGKDGWDYGVHRLSRRRGRTRSPACRQQRRQRCRDEAEDRGGDVQPDHEACGQPARLMPAHRSRTGGSRRRRRIHQHRARDAAADAETGLGQDLGRPTQEKVAGHHHAEIREANRQRPPGIGRPEDGEQAGVGGFLRPFRCGKGGECGRPIRASTRFTLSSAPAGRRAIK